MEAAVIILVIAVVLLVFNKRFKNLVRNDFYLEKPDLNFSEKCRPGQKVVLQPDERESNIEVYCDGNLIGLVPEDYKHIAARKLGDERKATGEIVKVNSYGYKIHVEMKGEVRDIVR